MAGSPVAHASNALIPSENGGKKVQKSPPLKNIWTAPDGGPGPAEWRKQTGHRVHGLARRKGELNPTNWGFHIHDELLTHPIWAESKSLPPKKIKAPPEKKLLKEKGEKKEKEKKVKEKKEKVKKEKKVKEEREKGPGFMTLLGLFGMGKKKAGKEEKKEGGAAAAS